MNLNRFGRIGGEILRALLAANGSKMLAKEARRKMRLSKQAFGITFIPPALSLWPKSRINKPSILLHSRMIGSILKPIA
jgi:hypothetical protein